MRLRERVYSPSTCNPVVFYCHPLYTANVYQKLDRLAGLFMKRKALLTSEINLLSLASVERIIRRLVVAVHKIIRETPL